MESKYNRVFLSWLVCFFSLLSSLPLIIIFLIVPEDARGAAPPRTPQGNAILNMSLAAIGGAGANE